MTLAPPSTGAQRARAFGVRITPWAAGAGAVVLAAAPDVRVWGADLFAGAPVMVIYFWSVCRPGSLSQPAAFGIGLSHDLLSGGPAGLWALVFLLVHVLLAPGPGAAYPRGIAWAGFIPVAALALVLGWIGHVLFGGGGAGMGRLFWPFVLCVLVYAAAGRLFVLLAPRPRDGFRT